MTLRSDAHAPSFFWRTVTLLALWLIIFGFITAMTPWAMEAGVNVTQEKMKAVIMAPLLGGLGLASVLGGPRPSLLCGILSFVILAGSTAWMLFRCQSKGAFWMLAAANMLIITAASLGFSQMTHYWNENP